MRRNAAICIVLIVATWLVYGQTSGFDFVSYDDPDYVTENSDIALGRSGAGLEYALKTPVMGFYHPITVLSLLLDYELYGLEAAGYHVTNVVLHMLNSLLLFGLLQYATRRTWPSAAVAAVFALHPLHVESVAWIAERKDVLSTCFGLGCLWAYAGYTRSGSQRLYILSAVLLSVGLLAKSMLVTLPVLLLLLDYWPLDRLALPGSGSSLARWWETLRPRLVEKLPFIAVAAALAVATIAIQLQAGAMGQEAIDEGSFGFSLAALPNVAVSYVRYLAMTMWPSDLSALYPHPNKTHSGGTALTDWQVVEALLLLVVISIAVFRVRRRYAIVGWLWYLVSLLPVIGFIQFGSQALADRYTYVPSIGLFALVCFGVDDWVRGLAERKKAAIPVAGALAVAVIAAYGVVARSATAIWRDSHSLYEQGLRVNPRNVLMRYNLANLLRSEGELDVAMDHFRTVIEIDPGHYQAHINLGEAFAAKRKHVEAVKEYRFALKIRPNHVIAHNNLGNSLSDLGQLDEAASHYRAAAAQEDGSPLPHYNLGNLRLRQDRFAEAEKHYRDALALRPGYLGAGSNLGNALLSQGKLEEAIAQYRRVLAVDPENAVSKSGLKIALRRASTAASAAQ